MRALRSHIALLLLLCLTRTLVPEAWILALHAHEHTTDKPASAPRLSASRSKSKPQLGTKHQHCAVEHFYDVPLLLAAPVLVPTPLAQPVFCRLAQPQVLSRTAQLVGMVALRGPPARG